MKYNIFLRYRIYVYSILALGGLLGGCTKSFDTRNVDPTKLTSLTPLDVKSLFPTALYAGMNTGDDNGVDYQQSQNLFADDYAQYFASTQTAFSSDRYNIVQQWVRYQWYDTYVATLPSLVTIINETTTPETVTLNAIARIWKVFVLHRTTDYYGPIPYSHIGSDSIVIPYDSQRDVYYDFFKELTEAASDLKNNLNVPSYGDKDMIYDGDNAKWLAFANTLRLRLALRISMIEPDKAKSEAEAAVADGVMTDVSQDAYLKVAAPNNYNGLGRITAWNEFRMSASMESLLKGYNDPRMSKYFQPAVATGLYDGIRNGMVPAEQTIPENDYEHNSNVSARLGNDAMFSTPMSVMYSAEAYFLRAEGALNGWNMGGTAKDLYNKGIEMSLRTWGVTDMNTINNYINNTSLPVAPGGYFNTPALTDIPVKFSSDPAEQREQILTQKWLALFPDGFEAWAEVRRSGYPKRYPLIHSDNPDVPKDKLIRRIPFLDFDKDKNGPAVEAAKALLDGPDNAATPLWWDTHK
jgi:hypothetical protein